MTKSPSVGHGRILSSFCDRGLTRGSTDRNREVDGEGGLRCKEGFCAVAGPAGPDGTPGKKTCVQETCMGSLGDLEAQAKSMSAELDAIQRENFSSDNVADVVKHDKRARTDAAGGRRPFIDIQKQTTTIGKMLQNIKRVMKAENAPVGSGAIRQSFRPLAETLIAEAGEEGLGAEVKDFAAALQDLDDQVHTDLTKEKIAMMTTQDVPDTLRETIRKLNEVLAGGTYLRSKLNKFSELANLGLARAEVVGNANLKTGHTPVSPEEEEIEARNEMNKQGLDPMRAGPYEPVIKPSPQQLMRRQLCMDALFHGRAGEACNAQTLQDIQTGLKQDLSHLHHQKAEVDDTRAALQEKYEKLGEDGLSTAEDVERYYQTLRRKQDNLDYFKDWTKIENADGSVVYKKGESGAISAVKPYRKVLSHDWIEEINENGEQQWVNQRTKEVRHERPDHEIAVDVDGIDSPNLAAMFIAALLRVHLDLGRNSKIRSNIRDFL